MRSEIYVVPGRLSPRAAGTHRACTPGYRHLGVRGRGDLGIDVAARLVAGVSLTALPILLVTLVRS